MNNAVRWCVDCRRLMAMIDSTCRYRSLFLALTVLAGLVGATNASAASSPSSNEEAPGTAGKEEESVYSKKGTMEIGGNVSLDWSPNTFSGSVGPTIGYFVAERVEISALFNFNYDREGGDEVGTRTITRSGDAVIEPSYHHPVTPTLLAFGGLGAGVEYSSGDDSTNFELVPRVGLNIETGTSAVFTPSFKLPVVFKPGNTEVGAVIEIGVSGAF